MKKVIFVFLFSFLLIGFSSQNLKAAFTVNGPNGTYRGEVYSNDFMSEANANIYWNSGSSDEVYMYLKNIDSGYNRNTNAEVKLYSKDAFGGYTYQMKAREEGVPLGDKVELYSVKSWYNNENFRGYYYYTWISNGAHSLYSEGY